MAAVEVFAVGDSKGQQLQHMVKYNRRLYYLGQRSIRPGKVLPEDSDEYRQLYKDGRMHLNWLETADMTPEIEERTKMKLILTWVFNDPKTHYPNDMQDKAKALFEKWENENWGANAVVDEDVSADQDATTPPKDTPVVRSELPPPDHPIFGERGIMHGVLVIRGVTGKKTYKLNPNVPRKSFKVFGHNDMPVGTWFANQMAALARGAHGSSNGGISGTTNIGAYSIVISDNYDDLDDDQGDVVYYSGSNSHNNDDPTRPAESSTGTKALKSSLRTGHPVRVLRSGGPTRSKVNPWLPAYGLRYDGLYRVVSLRERRNTKGGLYEQFQLRREPDQTPLEDVRINSPTSQQKRDLAQLQREY
ncbi:PUA-like domain-containing protein [Hypoxylon crocopeplum]|nr:PUA-like domain-containing protein [Hypoxylon crocopeplum]